MKDGSLAYTIQVKVKDKATGRTIPKTKTWHPEKGMTAKQIEKALAIEEDIFEKEVKNSVNSLFAKAENFDITFKEFAEQWLEKTKRDHSLSYYVNCKEIVDEVSMSIGGYKMREITPAILQSYYDLLDSKKKITIRVVPKENFRQVLANHGYNYVKLRYELKIQSFTLSNALNGKPVSKSWSTSLAERTNIPFNELFDERLLEEEYAYETIHKYKRTIRTIFSSAKKNRIVADNYASAEYINFPKRKTKEIEVMDDESAKKLFQTLVTYPNIKARTAVMVFLLTGFRRGEVAGLEWDDVDFRKNTISVKRAIVTVTGHGCIEKEPKTEKSKRVTTMPKILVNTLLEYKMWQDNQKEMLGDYFKDTNKIFTQNDGKNIHPSTFAGWLDSILKEAELDHYSLHSIRHTNLTILIAAGVPAVTVSGRAGHARTSTTTDIYAKFLKSSDEVAANAIDKIFKEDIVEVPNAEVKEGLQVEIINDSENNYQKSDLLNSYRKAKIEMNKLGFKSYDEYLDYLEFVNSSKRHEKKDNELE